MPADSFLKRNKRWLLIALVFALLLAALLLLGSQSQESPFLYQVF
jgi:hypothetical protein